MVVLMIMVFSGSECRRGCSRVVVMVTAQTQVRSSTLATIRVLETRVQCGPSIPLLYTNTHQRLLISAHAARLQKYSVSAAGTPNRPQASHKELAEINSGKKSGGKKWQNYDIIYLLFGWFAALLLLL